VHVAVVPPLGAGGHQDLLHTPPGGKHPSEAVERPAAQRWLMTVGTLECIAVARLDWRLGKVPKVRAALPPSRRALEQFVEEDPGRHLHRAVVG
jgi:hypothetical protein